MSGRMCEGSFYGAPWAVYTREDANACAQAGGRVVAGGPTGCAASSIAAFAGGNDGRLRGTMAELSLAPLRRVQDEAGGHELVAALVELNRRAAPAMERLIESGDLPDGLLEAFAEVSALAAAILQETPPAGILEPDAFARLEAAARRFGEAAGDEALQQAIAEATASARPLVGQELSRIAPQLKPIDEGPAEQEVLYPTDLLLPNLRFGLRAQILGRTTVVDSPPLILEHMRLLAAQRAIERKAASLGWVGAPLGEVTAVPGGWRRAYQNADILVGADGVAYEVHGDIRAKYNALGGPAGVLGLPVTDERGTPDGIGRYNHFAADGSIYWTPDTGPMMVRGRVRQEWAAQGWERGPMGYPVQDQRALAGFSPADRPNIGWCLFQNGALVSVAGAAAPALAAEVSPDGLRGLIRGFFDTRLKAADGDLGLQPRVDLAVSGWSYGFWESVPRALTFRLFGFYDNGLLPDTDFELEVTLRFDTTWPLSFTYPDQVTLVAVLSRVFVRAKGLGSGKLARSLKEGVHRAFWRGGPEPGRPWVPDGAVTIADLPTGASQRGAGALDVVDVLTTAAGGLQVLVNPLPPLIGGFRRAIAQQRIDQLLEG